MHVPISGPMICEKALQLNKRLNGDINSLQVKDGSGDSVKGTGFEHCLLKARSFQPTRMELRVL